ncbi:helix-turn-helix domain-containing protein [Chryseobacterium fluminis]|uniref:helix-turn-helix transcriptional regulator n=1 Tax=Chryseobacterium fluminis TaxID=2983606 RepID=UPI00224C82E5|nr:helix-turn-helix domain-containing protein [Chryseobacterium sp. MMS21-Ot14]UZT97053.1 helix-turn-helix domain-containing protein [Chryseobacterium sp. MMS21-Ot14]
MAKPKQRLSIATPLFSKITLIMEENRYMDLNSLIKYIPFTKATIYSKVNRKQIPFKKIGKKLIFSKQEIDRWIDEGGNMTSEIRIPVLVV